jgi:hypothetical protein
MGAAIIFSTGRGRSGIRKYLYKLMSKPFKVIFTDRLRIFRTKE